MGKGKEIIYSAKRVWNIYVSTFFRRNWGRIADFGYRSRKIWRFIKLAWKDQEWDYEYMLRVEKAKLEDMARIMRSTILRSMIGQLPGILESVAD